MTERKTDIIVDIDVKEDAGFTPEEGLTKIWKESRKYAWPLGWYVGQLTVELRLDPSNHRRPRIEIIFLSGDVQICFDAYHVEQLLKEMEREIKGPDRVEG